MVNRFLRRGRARKPPPTIEKAKLKKSRTRRAVDLASTLGKASITFRLDDGSKRAIDEGLLQEFHLLLESLEVAPGEDFPLHDVSIEVFHLFMVWLYRRPSVSDQDALLEWSIDDTEIFGDSDIAEEGPTTTVGNTIMTYINLGILAETWGIKELKDMVVELLSFWADKNGSASTISNAQSTALLQAYRVASKSDLKWPIVRAAVISALNRDSADETHEFLLELGRQEPAFAADVAVCFVCKSLEGYELSDAISLPDFLGKSLCPAWNGWVKTDMDKNGA